MKASGSIRIVGALWMQCFAGLASVPLMLGLIGCGEASPVDEPIAVGREGLTKISEASLGWPATDISVVSRGSNRFDAFTIESNTLKYHRWDGTTWSAGTALGLPAGVAAVNKVAAVVMSTASGARLDVFATGSDGHIYHRYQTNPGAGSPAPTFSGWVANELISTPNVNPNGKIGAVSRGTDKIDLFWFTPSNQLGHASAVNQTWQSWESGDTAGLTWLQIPSQHVINFHSMSVTSWSNSRLDVFFPIVDNSAAPNRPTYLEHHAWDASGGYREAILVEGAAGGSDLNLLTTVVAVPRNTGQTEYYFDSINFVFSTVVNKLRHAGPPGAFVAGTLPTTNVPGLNEGVTGSGPSGNGRSIQSFTLTDSGARTDLWGTRAGTAWQAHFQN